MNCLVSTRRCPLNNYWGSMNVGNAEKHSGIPFAGKILFRIAIHGIVKSANNAKIGVFGIVRIAIGVLTDSRCRANIVEVAQMEQTILTINFLTRSMDLWRDGRSLQEAIVGNIPYHLLIGDTVPPSPGVSRKIIICGLTTRSVRHASRTGNQFSRV